MLSFAIIGWGYIAKKHREAIESIEGVQLVAVCDTSEERLEEVADVACFTNFSSMLQAVPDIDVVCICTPSGLHAQHAIQAINAGKHIVVEKPIALTLEDADRIREKAVERGVKVAVVHPNRFRPAIQKLKKALDEGMFGRLSHLSATVRWNRSQAYYDQALWRGTRVMDGGVLMNQAIHSLDLLQWLAGPAAEVKAIVDTRIRRIEAEDIAIAAIKFESGALGIVEAATTIYEKSLEETLSVFGEQGYIVIGGPTANWIKHLSCSSLTAQEATEWIREIDADPYGESGHMLIIRDFAAAVREDREPMVTAMEGRNALKLALEICQDGLTQVVNKPAGGQLCS